jgi:hypothetical protein
MLRTLNQERAQISITGLGNAELWIPLSGLVSLRDEVRRSSLPIGCG